MTLRPRSLGTTTSRHDWLRLVRLVDRTIQPTSQPPHGIDEVPVDQRLEGQVAPGGQPRRAREADELPARPRPPAGDDAREVVVRRGEVGAVHDAVVDDDTVAVPTGPARTDHRAC